VLAAEESSIVGLKYFCGINAVIIVYCAHFYRLSQQDSLQHLPRLFAACMKCMHSGNVAVAKMAAEVLIVSFLLCVIL